VDYDPVQIRPRSRKPEGEVLSQLHVDLSRSCQLSGFSRLLVIAEKIWVRTKMCLRENMFVHDEIRWSGCVVVVNHKFIVIQSSPRDHFRKDLAPGQFPLLENQSRVLTESNPRGGRVSVVLSWINFLPFPTMTLFNNIAFQSEVTPSLFA